MTPHVICEKRMRLSGLPPHFLLITQVNNMTSFSFLILLFTLFNASFHYWFTSVTSPTPLLALQMIPSVIVAGTHTNLTYETCQQSYYFLGFSKQHLNNTIP